MPVKRLAVILVLISNMAFAADQTTSLEKRVAALEQEVVTLKEENRKLKESAFDLFATQLEERERKNARLYYENFILPMMSGLLKDFGATAPTLPKEAEVNTLADAYRPMVEMLTQLGAVASGEETIKPLETAHGK